MKQKQKQSKTKQEKNKTNELRRQRAIAPTKRPSVTHYR
jgi:hypothetical protein